MEEPERKSFLDVLKRNLGLADRFAFITRLMYIGEYHGNNEDLIKKMKSNIKELNEEHGELVVTGVLIVYPKYFIHLIEAPEETIYRHFQSVLATKTVEGEEFYGHIILFPAFYNAFRCFYSEWHNVFISDPPWLLDQIVDSGLDEIKNQVKICMSRIYELSEYLNEKEHKHREKINNALKNISSEVPHLLPEVTRIEYLLSVTSVATIDLRQFIQQFTHIPFFNFYNDRIWPPIKDFTPQIRKEEEPEERGGD